MRWNSIGLLGGRCLLEALQHNKSIMKLELAGNNIPSDTLKALGTSVSPHPPQDIEIKRCFSFSFFSLKHFTFFSHWSFFYPHPPFRADHRTQHGQTNITEGELQQDPGPQQGDSDAKAGKGAAGTERNGTVSRSAVVVEQEIKAADVGL